MYAKNCTEADLSNALGMINRLYKGNVIWKAPPTWKGNQLHFTLTVASSRGLGARLGFPDYKTGNQRHMAAACWHVHGNFFDALFKVNPQAKIVSQGKTITREQGNWQDRNIGSMMQPMMWSEACECQAKGIA